MLAAGTGVAGMRNAGEARVYLLVIHMCHHIQQDIAFDMSLKVGRAGPCALLTGASPSHT